MDEEGRPGLHRGDTEHPLWDCTLPFQVSLEGQSLSTILHRGVDPPLDRKELLSNHLVVLQIKMSAHEHACARCIQHAAFLQGGILGAPYHQ